MECEIRSWKIEDAKDFITAILNADTHTTFAFAIVAGGKVIGSIGVFRQGNRSLNNLHLG